MRRAIAIDPNDATVHCNVGDALDSQGKFSGAAAAFRRTIAIDPADVSFDNDLGVTLVIQAGFAGAAAAYRRVIAIDPNPQTRTSTFAPYSTSKTTLRVRPKHARRHLPWILKMQGKIAPRSKSGPAIVLNGINAS